MSSSPVLNTDLGFDAEAVRADRQLGFDAIRSLTAPRLSQYLEEFRAGRLGPLARVMDIVEERDGYINTAAHKAKNAIGRHGYEVIAEECCDDAEEKLAADQVQFLTHFFRHLEVRDAAEPNRRGRYRDLVSQMMDAKGKRYSVHRIQWRFTGGGRATATLHHLPLWFFEATDGPLRLLDAPDMSEGKPLNDTDWMVTVGRGVMIPASVLWAYKNPSIKDWVTYGSSYGFPVGHANTASEPGSAEWEAVKASLRTLSGGDSIVTRGADSFEWLTVGGAGQLPFEKVVDYCDRVNVTLWRGADLGTISQGAGGVGASLQGEETATIEGDDAQWIEETIGMCLVKPALEWRFGVGTPLLAKLVVKTAERRDEKARAGTYSTAIENGFPVTVGDYSREFSIPLPAGADPDALMEAPIVRQMEAAGDIDPEKGDGDDPPGDNPPGDGAGNDTLPPHPDLVDRLAREAFGLRAGSLEPVREIFERLVAAAEAGELSGSELDRLIGEAADEIPELFGEMDHGALADLFERGMGAGAVRGAAASALGARRAAKLETVA